ncbi:type II toxin-antitoxin system YoeB family toxin [Nitrospira sp. BLG_1]
MTLVFTDDAWEDYLYWQKHDKRMVELINKSSATHNANPW